MAYGSFRQFVDALDRAGELKRVALPVDTDLLISEWANREMKSPGGGKALLFEQPIVNGKQAPFPVAINTMGSTRRMSLALKVNSVEDIAQEIQLILKAKPPTDLREGWSLLKQGIHLLHARPNMFARHRVRKWWRYSILDPRFLMKAAAREIQHPASRSKHLAPSPFGIFPFSNAGLTMAGVSSRCPTFIPAIRRAAHGTWACTGCRFS